jgi:uncharacterized protein (DUF1684 family)
MQGMAKIGSGNYKDGKCIVKKAKKIGSKKSLSELINPEPEIRMEINYLKTKVKTLEGIIDNIIQKLDSGMISIEETSEAKRLRALREKGAIKYGD